MAGGDNRNGRRVRRISEREDSENDENIDLEEAIEQYKNAREAIQERISELGRLKKKFPFAAKI